MRPLIEKTVIPPPKRSFRNRIIAAAVVVLLLAFIVFLPAVLQSPPVSPDAPPSVPADMHTHIYSLTDPDARYLHTAATCTSPAFYYHSCQCGQAGTTTFPSGETAPHTPVTDAAVAAGCETSGLSEGSHCSICNTVLLVQSVVPPEGHKYSAATYASPATCTKCGATTGSALPQQPINITGPDLPVVQYRRFRITDCTYTATWNGDGTYYVTLYFTFTNETTTPTVGGIWATLSGIESSHSSAPALEPGESGSCSVRFPSIPAGNYTVIIGSD